MGFDLGTCVHTTLGTGVLVDVRGDDVHCVRLWKPRGGCGIISDQRSFKSDFDDASLVAYNPSVKPSGSCDSVFSRQARECRSTVCAS